MCDYLFVFISQEWDVDSTNVISFKNTSEIEPYLTQFYELLHHFYNANKLKINPDKTKFLITCKPKYTNIIKNTSFKAQNHIIKQSNVIKILGI